ncbi:MAG: hypothetical protein OSB36_02370 [Longimicrobiales bacterium]|nr:hypothetical protein [Longimicrobiales bacterium]
MLQPILPARWTDFSEYPATKFVTEWSFVQRGSVFATSAAMHTLSGHVTARLVMALRSVIRMYPYL